MALITREHYKTIPDELRFRGADWTVIEIEPAEGLRFIQRHHYAGGASNTAVAVHGLFRYGSGELMGVAWWLPPTKQSAVSVSPDWRNVLSLSRFVIAPEVPKNAATFIQARALKLLAPRWGGLVTYADTYRQHTGHIYRIFGWEYLGLTRPYAVYTLHGQQVSIKRGPRTYSHAEMLAMGCQFHGRWPKHKFRLAR